MSHPIICERNFFFLLIVTDSWTPKDPHESINIIVVCLTITFSIGVS